MQQPIIPMASVSSDTTVTSPHAQQSNGSQPQASSLTTTSTGPSQEVPPDLSSLCAWKGEAAPVRRSCNNLTASNVLTLLGLVLGLPLLALGVLSYVMQRWTAKNDFLQSCQQSFVRLLHPLVLHALTVTSLLESFRQPATTPSKPDLLNRHFGEGLL